MVMKKITKNQRPEGQTSENKHIQAILLKMKQIYHNNKSISRNSPLQKGNVGVSGGKDIDFLHIPGDYF